jgi:hypothetical protein
MNWPKIRFRNCSSGYSDMHMVSITRGVFQPGYIALHTTNARMNIEKQQLK